MGFSGLKKLFGEKIEVLLLNTKEAIALSGFVDVKRNLKILSELAKIVVITEGKHGAHATDGENYYFVKPFKVKVEDVTGAGDSFGSGFTAALIKGKSLESALLWGSANASSVVRRVGTKNDLLSENELKKFLAKHGKENKVVKTKLD